MTKKKERKKRRAAKSPTPAKPTKQVLPVLSLHQQRWLFCLALVLCTSLVLKLFFTKGHTYSLDGASLTSQTLMVYDSLREGELPLWSNRWYGGFPLLQFYPPLFFYLTALLNLLVNNLIFSIKLMVFIGQVLSGVMVFLLVEEITDNRQAGFIGGLAFALAPWHIYHILDFCRFTAIFIYTFLPLPFLFFEKYRHQKLTLPQAGILIGLSISLLIAFQYAYALFITLLLVIYVALNSISRRRPFIKLQHLWLLGIAGLVCLGTALAFIVPYIMESQYVGMPILHLSAKQFNVDSATFGTLLTRQDIPAGHKGYIGLSFLLLSLVGVFSALRQKRYPLLLMYAFCFYIVLGHETALYKYIPFVYAQEATERLILYLILFIAILAGEGVKFLKTSLPPHLQGRAWQIIFLLVVGVCFLDVAVTRNRHWASTHGLARVYEGFSQKISHYDPAHARTIRSIQICANPRIEWMFAGIFPSTLTIETPTSIIRGFVFHAVKNLFYTDDGTRWVKRDIESGNQEFPSQEFLYLMNISYTFYVGPDSRVQILESPHTTPAIASGHLSWQEDFSRYPKQGESGIIEPLIKQLGLNKERNSARQLLLIKDLQLPDRPFSENSWLRVLNFEQTTNKSLLEVEVSHDCYLRLSHNYYPFLHVYVDDQKVPFYETALSMIALPLSAGQHRIRVEPYLSPTRKVCYALSLISLVLALALYRRFRSKPVDWGKNSGQDLQHRQDKRSNHR